MGRSRAHSPVARDGGRCGDITYVPAGEGPLHLATVIDTASRRVVGWATADRLRTELLADALRAACRSRRPAGPARSTRIAAASARVVNSLILQGISASGCRPVAPAGVGTVRSRSRSSPR
ncbi:DDE-type integrase/transposase/recombinase [Kitasatospora cineracea]